MLETDRSKRQADATQALEQETGRHDGAQVIAALSAGLELSARLFLDRIRGGLNVGDTVIRADLARMPALAECYRAVLLVETVESGVQVHHHHYLRVDEDWYEKWLALTLLGGELPLKQIITGIAHYQRLSPDRRQADLRVSLERRVREVLEAPVVVYRLLTLAVTVATASAFGDKETARSARHLQHSLVPQAAQCPQCHGEILPSGKLCSACGNPFWRRDWLGAD